jgi:O-glycosyl hydrolase
MRKLLKIAIITCLLAACTKDDGGTTRTPDTYTLEVAQQDLQTIRGWGLLPAFTVPEGSITLPPSINSVPLAREVLFTELGMNIYRVWLDPHAGVNYTADHHELNMPYIDELAELVRYAQGVGVTEYLMSIWSPPVHMKEIYDATPNEPTRQWRPRLKADCYELFADYVVDALKELHNRNLPTPIVLSLQNEPEGGWGWPGEPRPSLEDGLVVWYEGEDLAGLISRTRAKLDAAGLTTVRMGGQEEANYTDGGIFDVPTSIDPALLKDLDVFLIHAYAKDVYTSNSAAEYLAPMEKLLRNKRILDLPSWQTEFSILPGNAGVGLTDMERMIYAMRVLAADMVWAGHEVWMWWYGWDPGWSPEPEDSEQGVILGGNGVTEVDRSGLFEALSTIFHNAPRGSHVRQVITNDTRLKTDMRLMNDLAAFQSDAGTLVLLVNGTDTKKTYAVSGLTGSAGTLKTLSGSDGRTVTLTAFPVDGGQASVAIPPKSVNFIITNK